MHNHHHLGAVRVNEVDYDSVVIEQFSFWGRGEPSWAVPAWDERGHGDLAGPFASVAEAMEAIKRAR